MDKNGLSSFLLGLGVGVGIGMLFAPKSGSETRQLIKDKAGEGTDFLKQRGSELKQTAADWVEKGKYSRGRGARLSGVRPGGRACVRLLPHRAADAAEGG